MGYPKIPNITCDDIAKIFYEEDRFRKTNPCCLNCRECYEEYGETMCMKHDFPMDNLHEKCEDWR